MGEEIMAFEVRVVDKDKKQIPVKVFRKDGQYGPMYSAGVSYKKQHGLYKTSYIDLYFDKGVELENGSFINIYEASLSPTNYKGKVCLKVWKWDYNRDFKQVDTSTMSSGFQQIDDGCPF